MKTVSSRQNAKLFYRHLTDQELCRWMDRADPAVRELIERFEKLREDACLLIKKLLDDGEITIEEDAD